MADGYQVLKSIHYKVALCRAGWIDRISGKLLMKYAFKLFIHRRTPNWLINLGQKLANDDSNSEGVAQAMVSL